MKIENDCKLDFCDVLIKPKRSELSSRSEVSLIRNFKFKHSGREWTGMPIMASNMDTTGTLETYDVLSKLQMITVLHKFYTLEQLQKHPSLDPDYYSLSTGTNESDYLKTKSLLTNLSPKPHFLTIDVANGYSQHFVNFCKKIRQEFPDLTIIAGNVATGDMVQELLISAGVDICKCGIGSSGVCSTRVKTGVGVPQLSVCLECSDVANGVGGHIISDGGCTVAGDLAKAFGAGAHFVMLGGMFAGHTESGGETITDNQGKLWKMFYGMSSEYAQNKHLGGMKSYRSSEGRVRKIPFKGDIIHTVNDILGGLRSAGTYMGASCLDNFSKCCTFQRVNRQVNEIYGSTGYRVSEFKD